MDRSAAPGAGFNGGPAPGYGGAYGGGAQGYIPGTAPMDPLPRISQSASAHGAQRPARGGTSLFAILLLATGIAGAVVGGLYIANELGRKEQADVAPALPTFQPANTVPSDPSPPATTPPAVTPPPVEPPPVVAKPQPRPTTTAKPPATPSTTGTPPTTTAPTTRPSGTTIIPQLPWVIPSTLPPFPFPGPTSAQPPANPQPNTTSPPTTSPPTTNPTTTTPPDRPRRRVIIVPNN